MSSQGILFRANDDLISNRTSYDVFEKESPVFNNYLTVKFDLAVLDADDIFGYICLIKDKNEAIAYSATIHEKNDSLYFRLNVDSHRDLIDAPIGKKSVEYWEWHTLSISLQSGKNQIILHIDNKEYLINVSQLPSKFVPQIVFGKQDNAVDVPKIALRNFSIEGKNKTYSFPLSENEGTAVHDSSGKEYGRVSNPIWLINRSYRWSLCNSFYSQSVAAVNYNGKTDQIIIANKDSVIFYRPANNKEEIHLFKNKLPVSMHLGMSFMDTLNNRFYVYEIYGIDKDKPSMAALNLSDFSWNAVSNQQLDNYHHHHDGFFDPQKQLYILFGGFGNQEYSSDFLEYSLSTDKWKKTDYSGDKISPRFFSGEAVLNSDETLVYGGIGNETGDQNLGKSYFYDCFLINHSNHTLKKLWTDQLDNPGIVSVRNMIVSDDEQSFYTLCYPEYESNTFIKLYRFSIQDGSFEILGDSIPMVSERIETNANLYYNSLAKELYCVTQEFAPDSSSRIKIYSLSYPPISKLNLLRTHSAIYSSFNLFRFCLIVAGLIFLAVLFIGYEYLRRKKTKAIAKALTFNEEYFAPGKEADANSITLFGDFTVKDKSGKEITYQFSPKIKQLFLFILLSGEKNGQGIGSAQIDETIWPDKNRDSAKNLRGVTLNQIRKILLDVAGIELIYSNEYFKLEMQEPLYCDYLECNRALGMLASGNDPFDAALQKIGSIVNKGPFLESLDFDFIQVIRKDFCDQILALLSPLLDSNFKAQHYDKAFQLVQIIYRIDETNETALRYELELYRKAGMKAMIQKRYAAFNITYKEKNNQDFPYSIDKLTFRHSRKSGL